MCRLVKTWTITDTLYQVDNATILPGAGMVTMAIEATKQVVEPSMVITGYELKNVNFLSALKVPVGGAGAETRFYLRPQDTATGGDTSWWRFTLCSHDGSWVKNCEGSIKPITTAGPTLGKKSSLADQTAACPTALDANRFYEMLGSFGFQFGPAFHRISGISSDLRNHLVTDVVPYQGGHPHWSEQYTIHPTTLDALMQSVPLLRSQGGMKKIPISIPSHIDRAWLSNSGLSVADCSSLKLGTTIHHVGRQECVSEISVWSQDGNTPLIQIEDVVFSSIGSESDGEPKDDQQPSKCQQVAWKPDLNLMTKAEIEEYFASHVSNEAVSHLNSINIETVIHGYISRALELVSETRNVNELSLDMQRYIEWLQCTRKHNDGATHTLDCNMFTSLCSVISQASAQGRLYVTAGEALLDFARGNRDTLDTAPAELVEASSVEKVHSPGYPCILYPN